MTDFLKQYSKYVLAEYVWWMSRVLQSMWIIPNVPQIFKKISKIILKI